MKLYKILALLFSLLFLSACLSTQPEFVNLQTKTIDAGNARSILIQINRGELVILESEEVRIGVGGQALYPNEVDYEIDDLGDQIVINIQDQHRGLSKNLVQINVSVPGGIKVEVESDNASVRVQGYHGELEVASTSGNVTVENTTGDLTLRSNRGNVTVQNCSGDFSVVGNYGTLTLRDNEGHIGVSTIMGTIMYEGTIQETDIVSLETDHGPIEVNLKSDSNLQLFVRSTSGDIACMVPNLSSTSRSCEGQIGAYGGTLDVRTVSGAVTLRLVP
jgi:hypothetical protein